MIGFVGKSLKLIIIFPDSYCLYGDFLLKSFGQNFFYLLMIESINDFKNPFFIGIAGSGMSALAQYLQWTGKNVSGSDRFFNKDEYNETKEKLEAEGIKCFVQNGEGITINTDLVVVSTAIEDTVVE